MRADVCVVIGQMLPSGPALDFGAFVKLGL